jgi:hypothetical protein
MNIFKSLLFLEGYIADPSVLGDGFGQSYGNKVASERAFGPEFGGNAAVATGADAVGCAPLACG